MKNEEKPKLTLLPATQPPSNERRDNDQPELLIDTADLPRAAREVRDVLATLPYIVERGVPMKVVKSAEGPPKAVPLTAEDIVIEVHRVRQPVKLATDGRHVPMTLPPRVARMYLARSDEWTPIEVREPGEYADAFSAWNDRHIDALVVLDHAQFIANAAALAAAPHSTASLPLDRWNGRPAAG
jgi:hypothetical protein